MDQEFLEMKALSTVLVLFFAAFLYLQPSVLHAGTQQDKSVLVKSADEAEPVEATKKLTRREQRKLGVLPRQLITYAIRLKKEGVDLKEIADRDAKEACMMLVGEAVSDNPKAWADPKAINWDALFAFIEKLIPLILQIIAAF